MGSTTGQPGLFWSTTEYSGRPLGVFWSTTEEFWSTRIAQISRKQQTDGNFHGRKSSYGLNLHHLTNLTLKTFDKLRIEVNQMTKKSFFIAYLESKQLKPQEREEHAKNAKNSTPNLQLCDPNTSTAITTPSPSISDENHN